MNQSVDIKVVPFSVIGGKLKTYAPGGYIPSKAWGRGMDLDGEVARIIKQSIGLAPGYGYTEQLYTISPPGQKNFDVSVVYYYLVAYKHIHNADAWTESVNTPDRSIIAYAKQRLRWKIEYTNVAYSLLPDEFVFGELQQVYEAILGRPMDKRNFRKKIFSLHILADTGKKRILGRARPAEVYRFKERKPTIVEIL